MKCLAPGGNANGVQLHSPGSRSAPWVGNRPRMWTLKRPTKTGVERQRCSWLVLFHRPRVAQRDPGLWKTARKCGPSHDASRQTQSNVLIPSVGVHCWSCLRRIPCVRCVTNANGFDIRTPRLAFAHPECETLPWRLQNVDASQGSDNLTPQPHVGSWLPLPSRTEAAHVKVYAIDIFLLY